MNKAIKRVVAFALGLAGIAIAACADSPTAVRESRPSHADVRDEQPICYIVDGVKVCVGGPVGAAPDSVYR